MDKTSASSDRIHARYWIETAFPLDDAAAIMAGEQSTGTFVRVPGETDELRERYAARVEQIVELGTVDSPSLAGSGLPKKHTGPVVRRTAEVTLSWPIENMGPSLPNLLATVAGNLFELKPFSGLKLLDVTLPPAFLSAYQGPQFGVEGTRRLTGVYGRPDYRHHHQAERRPDARTNRGASKNACRSRRGLYQGRRVAIRRPALPV